MEVRNSSACKSGNVRKEVTLDFRYDIVLSRVSTSFVMKPCTIFLILLQTLATARPNVLLIITDDQNDYATSSSGIDVQTPHLDAFKKQSLTFSNASCASPVCGPSRASMFSGLLPHRTGSYLNGSDPWNKSKALQEATPLPELFRHSGYTSWGMGKLFHAPLPEDRKKKQWDNRATANGGFGPFPDPKFQIGGKFFGVQEWDKKDTDFPDVKSANLAIANLKEQQPKPFFMVYGLWRPHNPWTAPRRFFDLYKPEKIQFPPPGYREDDLDDVPPGGHKLAAIYQNRWDKAGDQNPDLWRRIMHGYLACTSFADWNIGQVLKALDESPHADKTIVIITSDNGYHVGEKHHYGKSTLWEPSARVPLWIRLPGQKHAGKTCDASVSLIDLYPTLLKLCQLEKPSQNLDGRDLSPLLSEPESSWPHLSITTYGEGRFTARSQTHRYLRYPDGQEELYDHRKDPHEFQNLSGDEESKPLLNKFRSHLPKTWAPSIGGRNG